MEQEQPSFKTSQELIQRSVREVESKKLKNYMDGTVGELAHAISVIYGFTGIPGCTPSKEGALEKENSELKKRLEALEKKE